MTATSHEPLDVFDAIRADERHRVATAIREEAAALARYKREGGHPPSPVSPGMAFALAAYVEARS